MTTVENELLARLITLTITMTDDVDDDDDDDARAYKDQIAA